MSLSRFDRGNLTLGFPLRQDGVPAEYRFGGQAYKLYNTSSTSIGNYVAITVHVVKTTDEDDKVQYTFTDKQGQKLLERAVNGSEYLDTYYVYDDYGCLRFVLQPEYQATANLDLYAFQYKYDNHNNCIRKKLPGAQYVTYEYDSADRMIFSQDGVQRAAGKWTFYVYDSLDRLPSRANTPARRCRHRVCICRTTTTTTPHCAVR